MTRFPRAQFLMRNQGSWRNLGNGPREWASAIQTGHDGYVHVSQIFEKFIRSLQFLYVTENFSSPREEHFGHVSKKTSSNVQWERKLVSNPDDPWAGDAKRASAKDPGAGG